MNCAVKIEHLSKNFGEQKVLNDVCLQLEQGKIYGIIGRNGSGKSVLLKCIAGLVRPTAGTVTVFDKRIGKDVDFAPSTGIAIDAPGLLMRKSAADNMKALVSLMHKPNNTEIDDLLQLVGLDSKSRKHVANYSTGMKQRLGIAMALVDSPKLLMLDEPMSNLDVAGAAEMREIFRNLAERGKTLIIATHIAEDVEQLCDKVYKISEGKINESTEKMMG